MLIGEKIKELRLQKKLSIRELADKLEVSHAHISKMESDKGLPSLPMLEKIADLFGVHITYFFDQKKVDVDVEGADYVAIDKNKEGLSEDDMKKILEFVKDVKNGKFDLSKIQHIHFKD